MGGNEPDPFFLYMVILIHKGRNKHLADFIDSPSMLSVKYNYGVNCI